MLVDPGVPQPEADAAQLERVFADLLENALRHSKPEPVCLSMCTGSAGGL